MYTQSYEDFIKNAPDTKGKQFLIRFMNTPRPDFTELDKEVAAFEKQLAEEYLAGERAKRAAQGVAQ